MRKLIAVLLLLLPFAATAAPMTNDDVIKMVKGGLGEATVLQAIDAAEAGFDTSPDGLVKLKGGGVSDAVIQRIIARKSTAPTAAAAPAASPAPPPASVCRECGTITGIREIDKPGQASGVGAVAGGVLGGVLGRQIGGSNHRTAGTVLGAVGGGLAGHQIEKSAKSGKTWEVGVRFDDGNSRIFTQDTHPSWYTGARVRLVNGALAPL
ncbi:MAG: glycine zipper 2TM domain-containing protein [Betaproteobacteria bacterium]|nr:glycine zipper 2TM domain-containing protein [Betaproteobacteria bacterium]